MKATITLIALAAIALFTGCKTCKENINTSSYSYSLLDQDINSPHFNQNVAAFSFNTTNKGNAGNDCDANETGTTMTILNLTNQTMTFGYTANWNGLSPWSTAGTVTIPPSGTVDKGNVNQNSGNWSQGGFFTVTSGTITYQ